MNQVGAKKPRHRFGAGELVGGRYRVERVIASGGMAEVYAVVDEQAGGRWALKTPNDRYANNRRIVTRMVREARALAKFDDDNLVKVHDAGEHDGQFFMVMAFLDGVTLKSLAQDRELPLGVVLSLVRQIALGLHVLHAFGHVHRDVKPDNIIVLENAGQAEHRAVLIDLGIAKLADASTTSGGVPLGTPTYIAPEQAFGQPVDARADIYTLGLIMYELISGDHALTMKSRPASRQEWMQRQLNYDPPPLSSVVAGLHPALSNLVVRAMAKDRTQRFESATDLVEHLDKIVQALRAPGQLGATRLDPFLLPTGEENESGPQPIARIRPQGTETPDPGLPYRRTDIPSQPAPRPPMFQFAAEPPRVAEVPDARTARNTVRMLGPRMTQPNLDAPRASAPAFAPVALVGLPIAAEPAAIPATSRSATPDTAAAAPAVVMPTPPAPKVSNWQPTRADDELYAIAEPGPDESRIVEDAPKKATDAAEKRRMLNKRVPPAAALAMAEQAKARGRQEERKQRLARLPSTQDALLKGALVGIALVAIAVAVIAAFELRGKSRSAGSVTQAPMETSSAMAEASPPEGPLPPPATPSASATASGWATAPRASQTQPKWAGQPAMKQTGTGPAPAASAPPAPGTSHWLPLDDVPSAKPNPSGLEMPFHRKQP